MRTFFGSNGSKTSLRRVSVLCRTSGTLELQQAYPGISAEA
jgi:hypothetical protein